MFDDDLKTKGTETSTAFADVLRQIQNGQPLSDASSGLAEVVDACRSSGKKGTVTIKVTVDPKAQGAAVEVYADVTVRAPKPDAATSILFPAHRTVLQRDPVQKDMSLREVPVEVKPSREVNEPTVEDRARAIAKQPERGDK